MAHGIQGNDQDSLVISYLKLRKAVGLIGIALPLVLVAGTVVVRGFSIEPSISDYYYTHMRNVFVGSLWAMAVFFLSYRGYDRKDDLAGDVACVFAIGVALFPTYPARELTTIDRIFGALHLLSAAALFLTLAYFCLVLFRKGSADMTPRKLQRNRVYTVTGYTMLACIVAIGLLWIPSPLAELKGWDAVFWLEAIALWAFGWSWFVKGEGILEDRQPT